ncbi:MAG TPA: ribonuclease R [Rubricoccaceae bacterium]|nr:ribonuclease R [Rubricoccaceae bacterium]
MADARPRAVLKRQILSLLRNHGDRAFRHKEIAKALGVKDNQRYKLFRDVLEELSEAGLVAKVKGGRYQHRKARPRNVVEGTITVNPGGFGFVTVEGLDEDVFVPQHRLKTALDGDRVRVELAAPVRGGRDEDRREGEVIEVIERGRAQTVGTFDRMGHFAFVKPDDPRLTRDVYVPREAFNGAREGDKVVVSIDVFDDPKASPEGRVLEVLGPASDPRVAVLAVAIAHGAPSDFPEDVERGAAEIPAEIPEAEVARRLDLREKRTFTIDPVDAKDFDDAIHITRLPGGDFELGVHIADVSHYVREGTPLDEEAYARGTSTYLVDRVIPMLPEKLSNGVCSLRPNEDKLTFSCLMTVTPRGAVKDYRIAETVIRSRQRLTYEEAQAIIDGGTRDHPLKDDVLLAAKLARTLTKKRMQAGSIDFDIPEVRVVLDDEGRPVEVVRKQRQEANRLIEEFMLLANRTVAEEVGRRLKRPFVYRVHDVPNAEKIKNLAEYVRAFGYQLTITEGSVDRRELNALLHHVKGTAEEPVIETAAVQAMAKAVYSPNNIGHFGLGFTHYSHFTSPIRRYPDLIAHRLLKHYAAGGADADAEALAVQCKHLSERERAAADAERESVKLKQVEYVAQHLGDEFDGVVVGVTNFGVFVEMTALLTEGLVHVRDMDDDYWEYDARTYALVGAHTRRVIRLGDTVRVRVAAANVETRKVDLLFVDAERPGTGGRRRR